VRACVVRMHVCECVRPHKRIRVYTSIKIKVDSAPILEAFWHYVKQGFWHKAP
jgi:hypothetical protein